MRETRYTSDLNDEQWDLIKALFEPLPKEGHPLEISYREILNACFYVVRTGGLQTAPKSGSEHVRPSPLIHCYWIGQPGRLKGRTYLERLGVAHFRYCRFDVPLAGNAR